MEADERPNKIRKLSHDRDTDSMETSMAHVPDAGARTESELLPVQTPEADAADPSKTAPVAAPALNPSDGISTSAAAIPTATPSSTAGSSLAPPQAQTTSTTQQTAPSDQDPPLSKNAQKRLRRQQEWDAKKADRRIWRKEKNQARKERKREARAADPIDPETWRQRQREKIRPTQLPVTFLIDCDFDDKMRDYERISLAGQITRSYSDNKNAPFRAHLAVCSFGGHLKERFDTVLAKNYTNWKGTRFLDEDFVVAAEKAKDWMTEGKKGGRLASVFAKYAPANPSIAEEQPAASTEATAESTEEKTEVEGGVSLKEAEAEPKEEAQNDENQVPTKESEVQNEEEEEEEATSNHLPHDPALVAQGEVIYLSSDSDHTLTELKPYSTYIIGGIVDKNREKGICHARALAKGVKTARLPIGDYLEMASRKVLATNHVNEIMLRWLECGDWGEAFMKVIPKRKGGQLKGGKDEEEGEEEGDFEDQGDVGAEEDEREAEAETAEKSTVQA